MFSIIYMIRIRFFGPRELIQRYFSAAQYVQIMKGINVVSLAEATLDDVTASNCKGHSLVQGADEMRRKGCSGEYSKKLEAHNSELM